MPTKEDFKEYTFQAVTITVTRNGKRLIGRFTLTSQHRKKLMNFA